MAFSAALDQRIPGTHLHPMLQTRFVGVARVPGIDGRFAVDTPLLEVVLKALRASVVKAESESVATSERSDHLC